MELLNGEKPKETCSTGTCGISKDSVVNDNNNVANYSLDFTKKTNKDNLTPNAENKTNYMEVEPFGNNSDYSFI
jgi:hypothetical protein